MIKRFIKKVYIKFITTGKFYRFDLKGLKLKKGDKVLVKTNQGVELGIVSDKSSQEKISEEDAQAINAQILRPLSDGDQEKLRQLKKKAREYLPECEKKALYHKYRMRLLDADLSFDERKLTFYFSADGRIDFRALVSDLVRSFKKLIRLQQVGARDEAKYFAAFGKCGRPLCCATHLGQIDSISLDMAKEQDIATAGTSKISGVCGKLMCCLAYEAGCYKKMRQEMPKIGAKIKTSKGVGKIVAQNVLKNSVTARVDDNLIEVEVKK